MSTSYTSLLGLALPVTGELSGTWGSMVDNAITSPLDIAVAGTQSITGDSNVTLSVTNGDTVGTNLAQVGSGSTGSAQYAIILCSGARTALRTITAPAASKIYTVINSTTGGFSVKVVGAGPTTGVTIVAGESALIAWNGSDFIKISSNSVLGGLTVTSLTDSGLTSGRVTYAGTGGLLQDSANMTFSGTVLTSSFAGPVAATTLSASSTVSGTGFSTYLASPPAIGGTAAAAGAFTTLSASSTVSGTGFSTYLASPPAIGGTAAAAGSFTTLSASSTVTLSGGTANGVAYLNASKVLTTGTALTFDGSKLLVSSSGEQFKLLSSGDFTTTGTGYIRWYDSGGAKGYIGYAGTANQFDLQTGTGMNLNFNATGGTTTFAVSNAEQMRLTSTGLGIGTSSPATKLDVVGSIRAVTATTSANNLRVGNTGQSVFFGVESSTGGTNIVGASAYSSTWSSNGPIFISTNNGASAQAILDSSGNLGLGVTPSAWGSGYKAFEVGKAGSGLFSVGTDSLQITNNYYYNGTNYIYAASGYAERYHMVTGQHQWYIAPSGTAGNAITFTQAMTLDASGNLFVGLTTSYSKFHVKATTAADMTCRLEPYTNAYASKLLISSQSSGDGGMQYGAGGTNNLDVFTYDNIKFSTGAISGGIGTEAARIDSSGNLLVGTTSSAAGGSKIYAVQSTPLQAAQFDSPSSTAQQSIISFRNPTNGAYMAIAGVGSASSIATWSNGSMVFEGVPYSTGNTILSSYTGSLVFQTNGRVEAARIDSSGNLLVGTTSTGPVNANAITIEPANSRIRVAHGATANGTPYIQFDYGGVNIGSITQNTTTSVLYNVTSDQRLKENIVNAPEFGSVIDSIQVRSFDWKENNSHQRAGFIAQELVTVAPEAVHQPADPEEMMAVDYSKLVPMLVKEIQDLRKRLAAAGI